jgi:hypothetical protein
VKRSNLWGAGTLADENDIQYRANITLGGAPFAVIVDTGSSDLWVASNGVPNSNDTGKTTGVKYAIGEAQGPIKFADLTFAGYAVPQQAFFQVTPSSSQPENSGIMGLGPWFTSSIWKTLNTSDAKPPVDNLFSQNKTTPNYLTILLGRSDDPDNQYPGDLTVGEIVDGYDDVLNQPKLNVTWAKYGNQHWSTLVDPGGIIGPDGQPLNVRTHVSSTKNSKQLTTMFDSGYTLPQVPADVAQEIYSQIEGAQLKNIDGLGEIWTMDCSMEVNITFKFAGNSYPVHPLDSTMPASNVGLQDDSFCLGTFQPISSSATNADIDMILGMQFLKNAYLLVDYGDYTQDEGTTLPPYVQLLSTTNNTAQMHQEFVSVRLNGIDTTSNQKILQSTHSPTRTRIQSTWDKIKKGVIIGLCVVGGLVLLCVVGLCVCCLRRRGTRVRGQSYHPLGEPAPVAASEMHLHEHAPPVALAADGVEAYPPQHQPTDYQPQYPSTWNPYQTADHHSQLAFQPQYQTPYDPHHYNGVGMETH